MSLGKKLNTQVNRVFFKVLSSWSFFLKVNSCGSWNPTWRTKCGAVLAYRYMGEFLLFSYPYMELWRSSLMFRSFVYRYTRTQPKMSYHSYFPASKICQKDSPHQNVFKLTFSQRSFYVFRKDRQCKFIFLLSPSLDLINIISVRALEVMKVAGQTLQRSWRTTLADGSYLQPWMKEILEQSVILFNPFMFCFYLEQKYPVHYEWRITSLCLT